MKKRLALNTFIPLLLQIVTLISGFIIPRLILSSFGSQTYGLVNSISQFLAVISFMDMGIGSVMRYNLYRPIANNDDYGLSCVYCSAQKYFRLIAKALFIYVLVLVILYPILVNSQVDALFSIGLILALSISSFAQFYFGQVNQILLLADQKGYISSGIQIFSVIINTILSVILINLGTSIHIVKLTASIVFAVKPILLELYVRKNYNIDRKVKYEGEPIKQKWNGLAQHISAVILDQTDILVLTTFSTLINVSIYSTYNLVLSGIKILMLSMTNGIEAYIGSLIAKNEKNKLNSTFVGVEWIIHTFTVFVFSCTIVLIVPFVLVYTKGVEDANYSVPLFALLITIANAAHCLRLPYSIVILAAGHYKQTQSNYIISASINILLSIIFVSKFGLIGVAIGTIAGMMYQTIWMAWYTSKNIIERKLFSFAKQISVDAITMLLIIFCCKSFSLVSLTYVSWIILALKCVVVAFFIIAIISILFFRDTMISVINSMIKRKQDNV